jgi:hypothetical protein
MINYSELFPVYQSAYHATPCNLDTESVVVNNLQRKSNLNLKSLH